MMTDSIDYTINKADTWPKLLQYNYKQYGDTHIAMRHKYYGIWQTFSWKDYLLNVKHLSLGLLSVGFKEGDKAIIIGENTPYWYFAQLAIQAAHGIAVGIYSNLSQKETGYIVTHSDASFAIVQDQEQVDKLLEIRNSLPNLKKIIYWSYEGLSNYNDSLIIGIKEIQKYGEKYADNYPNSFENNIETGNGDDICSIIYSSGTTGDFPNGACHTYRTIKQSAEFQLAVDPWHQEDNIVSFLPPVWMAEQWFGIGCHLLSGSILNFAESVETFQADIREIGPNIILYETWLWEREAGACLARILGTDKLKQFFYDKSMPIGHKMSVLQLKKMKPNSTQKLINSIAHFLIFRPIRDSLGLNNARICYATGSMVSPEVFKFYHTLNIPLKSIYGTTEGGALTCPKSDEIQPDTVGLVHNGVEFKIADTGEMLFNHSGLFKGYYKNPSLTDDVLKDGWYYSGDSGSIKSNGHIVFLDRIKDIILLKDGTKFSPQLIESKLRFSRYIKNAWVLAGQNKSFVSAIIIIDYFSVARWSNQNNISYTNFADLSQKSETYELIRTEILKVNNTLSPETKISKFVNLYKEFDPDELELTRNRKLRRTFMEEQYRPLINAIYSGDKDFPIEAEINTPEGRKTTIKTLLNIKSTEGED